ncbi:MAG TPA: hypothetical protein VFM54_20030 [Micromonosporaceae bacterium]|nr:hypothetical protein [Micromonosporaceae bacterium]
MARDAAYGDPRHGVVHAVWWPDGSLDGFGLGAVPAHCPYRPGDWVVMHGTGHRQPYQTRQYGFRGVVLGHMGDTLLRGLTDDGREWCEHWGGLDRDGTPGYSMCTCCPHPRVRRRPRPHGVQDGLFGLDDLRRYLTDRSLDVGGPPPVAR